MLESFDMPTINSFTVGYAARNSCRMPRQHVKSAVTV